MRLLKTLYDDAQVHGDCVVIYNGHECKHNIRASGSPGRVRIAEGMTVSQRDTMYTLM